MVFIPKYLEITWRIDLSYLKRMLKYTLPLVLVGVAGVINQSGYIVLLKQILPGELMQNLSEGGVYAAAMRIAILMSLFTTAFNYAAEPFFFNESKRENARQTYADVAKAFTIAGCVIMVGILMYLDVIQLLLGRSFRSALYLVPILLLAFFFLGLYYNFSIWYKLDDKTRFGAYISGGGVIVTLLVSIFLIPEMGKAGSAWAALACYGFMATACYVLGRKYFPIPYDLRSIGTLVFISALAWGTSIGLINVFDPGLGGRLVINTVIMAAFLGIIYGLEKELILSVVKRRA
jgi:O-antigen/teichoic acid export membrane protein